MRRTADSSPFFAEWVASHDADLLGMREAIEQRNFDRLAELTEFSCLKMHGLMMSAQPGLVYWTNITLAVVDAVKELQHAGVPVCFTIDAGPQVKAVCPAAYSQTVKESLEAVNGVNEVMVSSLGAGARLT